jgi:hypothetical protein
LHEIEHGPFVLKQAAQLLRTHLGFCEHPDLLGEIAEQIQELPVELLGIDDIKDPALHFEKLDLFIDRLAVKLVPSFVGLLGRFGVAFHEVLLLVAGIGGVILLMNNPLKNVGCQEWDGYIM